VKILADVNVSVLVVTRLRELNVEIERVPEVMDSRTADQEIVEFAFKSGSVLLTHDQDFTAILALSGARKPSLINLRTASIDFDFLARCVQSAITGAEVELQAGAIVTVEDGGIRVRRLPIGLDR
jgi:predicted nuclease of predicted toxin-antitoxin system